MNDELDTLDDAKLSECFAVEVAGYQKYRSIWIGPLPKHESATALPSFATDASAVLPYLCLYPWHAGMHHPTAKVKVSVYAGTLRFGGDSAHFSRSACIALIRAKRASK